MGLGSDEKAFLSEASRLLQTHSVFHLFHLQVNAVRQSSSGSQNEEPNWELLCEHLQQESELRSVNLTSLHKRCYSCK